MDLLRGQVAFASGLGSDAPPLLLKAARRLEPLDPGLARETYLTAWMAALFAGHLAGAGDLLEVCRAARAMPRAGPPQPADLLLDGLALLVTDGPAAAAPALRQAVSSSSPAPDSSTTAEELRLGLAGPGGGQRPVGRRRLAGHAGPAGPAGPGRRRARPAAGHSGRAGHGRWSGAATSPTAAALIAESDAVCAATGTRRRPVRRDDAGGLARPRGRGRSR